MHTSRMTVKGQVTIPMAIRKQLKIGPKDIVGFEERGGEIVLRPVRKTLLDFYGAIRVDGPQDFEAIRRSVQADVARRVAREGH